MFDRVFFVPRPTYTNFGHCSKEKTMLEYFKNIINLKRCILSHFYLCKMIFATFWNSFRAVLPWCGRISSQLCYKYKNFFSSFLRFVTIRVSQFAVVYIVVAKLVFQKYIYPSSSTQAKLRRRTHGRFMDGLLLFLSNFSYVYEYIRQILKNCSLNLI